MQQECVFCNIISGKIPSDILYQDDQAIAIRDVNPQAPTHLLVLPKSHISTLNDLTPEQGSLAGHLVGIAIKLAQDEGIASKGYRLAINCGQEGGQVIPHVHIHVLGGRKLSGTIG